MTGSGFRRAMGMVGRWMRITSPRHRRWTSAEWCRACCTCFARAGAGATCRPIPVRLRSTIGIRDDPDAVLWLAMLEDLTEASSIVQSAAVDSTYM